MFKVPSLNKNKNNKYFNSASQVALWCMLSDWAHVKGSSVVQRLLCQKCCILSLIGEKHYRGNQ